MGAAARGGLHLLQSRAHPQPRGGERPPVGAKEFSYGPQMKAPYVNRAPCIERRS